MSQDKAGITVLDLFCGGGGFSEGFYQAGFTIVAGIDNWDWALKTHEVNGLGKSIKKDMLKITIQDVLAFKGDIEKDHGQIDVIIGSPPCTEFSYAKNGGKGDIEKGMVLVRKFLLFIAIFKPKYWVMENAPRLETILNKECIRLKDRGWKISYEKLGILPNQRKELNLVEDFLVIPDGKVFLASDYGAHQNRRRFIAGNFPINILASLERTGVDVSLASIINGLEKSFRENTKGTIIDPNYPNSQIKICDIRDYNYDASLHPIYWEALRHYKRRHIQYGQMHLPENLLKPSRTVLATHFPMSREALVLGTEKRTLYHGKERTVFRQPTVREVACIQGFPLNFQLKAPTIGLRYKLIGNAVPCQLSFAIALSITEHAEKMLSQISDTTYRNRLEITLNRQKRNNRLPIISQPNEIGQEANNLNRYHNKLKSGSNRRIRRKLLASRIYGLTFEVIFENSIKVNKRIQGGIFWKVCMQKLKGLPYYQVYLDEKSVNTILKALDSYKNTIIRELIQSLTSEYEKGIPFLKEEWEEFPSWKNESDLKKYLSYITEKRVKIPDIALFQTYFTQNIVEIGDYASPIDFFDGIDAIILRLFTNNKFEKLRDLLIHIDLLEDEKIYSERHDESGSIKNTLLKQEVPLITIVACLLSVLILSKMYENTKLSDSYVNSLEAAAMLIQNWSKS